jgi:hypothetical protein
VAIFVEDVGQIFKNNAGKTSHLSRFDPDLLEILGV